MMPRAWEPEVDRRIIDGMVGDRRAMLLEMAARGIAPHRVAIRAAQLGLSEGMIRRAVVTAKELADPDEEVRLSIKARTCLACDGVFASSGPSHRTCTPCAFGNATRCGACDKPFVPEGSHDRECQSCRASNRHCRKCGQSFAVTNIEDRECRRCSRGQVSSRVRSSRLVPKLRR